MSASVETIDQPAIDQCGNDGAQERRRYWNAENAHGLPDSAIRTHHGMGVLRERFLIDQATPSRNASSAAFIASGVPTCIHTPSSLSPNSRSCSLARSNIVVSENSPAGAS